MSQTTRRLVEEPRGDAFVYQLVYQDLGTRSLDARPQVEIATERRLGRLFHDGALGGSLDLAIDPDAVSRSGPALATAPR
jgi:hypothetical protein